MAAQPEKSTIERHVAMSGAQRLKRVFGIDVESCARCGRLFPLLARDFTVMAVDLPGHGLSSRPASSAAMSLPGMASALDALLESLEIRPLVAVGHSAGAAILVAMCLWETLSPALLIALNGALLPLPGLRGVFFRHWQKSPPSVA